MKEFLYFCGGLLNFCTAAFIYVLAGCVIIGFIYLLKYIIEGVLIVGCVGFIISIIVFLFKKVFSTLK